MAKSATLCQKFVVRAMQNVIDQFPQVYIVSYMDAILLAYKNEEVLLETCGQL